MKLEQSNMKDENNREIWEAIISKYKSNFKEYKKKIKNLEENDVEEQNNGDYLDPYANINLNQLNVKQALERGDAILKEDEKIIFRMVKIVKDDVEKIKEANVNINSQKEKLDIVDDDLKEIDLSLDRSKKKIKSMYKYV